jgi:hypothetical protein
MSEVSITLYIAAASAVGSMLAAFAAWRSSCVAKKSIQNTEAEEYRRLSRDLAVVGQKIVSKAESINRLCDELKLQYSSLAIFTKNSGGSREKLFIERAKSYKLEVSELVMEANANIIDKELSNIKPSVLHAALVSYSMSFERILEMQETINQEKEEIGRQITIYQVVRAINGN